MTSAAIRKRSGYQTRAWYAIDIDDHQIGTIERAASGPGWVVTVGAYREHDAWQRKTRYLADAKRIAAVAGSTTPYRDAVSHGRRA